jgi:hypothetical protein
MVRFEVEILASVSGFSVDFGGQCHLFPEDQNILKKNHTVSRVNGMDSLKLLRVLWPDHRVPTCQSYRECLCYGQNTLQALSISTTVFHGRWVSCHHRMAHLQVVDGRNGHQLWRVAAYTLKKQSQTADKGWCSNLELTSSHCNI